MNTGQYARVGCFGKLPIYEEHLREGLGPSSSALRQILFEGRGALHEAGGSITPTLSRRFLYGPPGSADVVAGVIRPSRDKANRDDWFFSVFVTFARRAHGRYWAYLPTVLSPVWDALDDAWDSLAAVATHRAFQEMLASTAVPFPEPAEAGREAFSRFREEDAGARMFARADGANWATFQRNFPDLITRIKRDAGEVRVELPVGAALEDASLETTFWIELVNRQFFLRRFEPQVFIESGPARKDRHVLLLFGKTGPEDYAAILGCGSGDRTLRPASDGSSGTPTPTAASYGELLDSKLGG